MKKKKLIGFFIILILCMLILPTFSSIFRDLCEVFKFNFKRITKPYIRGVFLSYKTYHRFFSIVDPPNVLGWAISGIVLLYYIFGLYGIKDQETYTQIDEYGSHGTSRFLKIPEIKKIYYDSKLGWFLGSYEKNKAFEVGMDAAYHPINQDLNMQMVVIGPPGCGKTTGFVLPNIYNMASAFTDPEDKVDFIITDPKPELYPLTADFLEKQGYDVHVLDFTNLKYGDTLNSIPFISDEKEMMETAENYIESVRAANGVKSGGEDFYPESTSQLLGALIGYVKQKNPLEKQTFSEIARMVTTEDLKNPDKAEDFFDREGIKGAALQLYKNFTMSEDPKTRGNILIGLATKLKLFAIEGVRNITNSSTIDIRKLGAKKDRPMALFIFMPDNDDTFAPVINMEVTTILNQLYKTARLYGKKLYNPVALILEEMANIGKLKGIQRMLGTMRAKRIYPMMIWQSLPQMQDRYGEKGASDIMSQCDTHVYLGLDDPTTANYCSNELGPTTIKIQGTNRRNDGFFGANAQSENLSYQKRPLMFPDECMRMNTKNFIMWQRGRFPSFLYKVQCKYWIDKYKVCNEKNVTDLPEIKRVIQNDEVPQSDKIFTDGELQEEQENINSNIEIKNEEDKSDFEENEIPEDPEMANIEEEFTLDEHEKN